MGEEDQPESRPANSSQPLNVEALPSPAGRLYASHPPARNATPETSAPRANQRKALLLGGSASTTATGWVIRAMLRSAVSASPANCFTRLTGESSPAIQR